jgi:hypothetical protein
MAARQECCAAPAEKEKEALPMRTNLDTPEAGEAAGN